MGLVAHRVQLRIDRELNKLRGPLQ
jgi:hypothetical protein